METRFIVVNEGCPYCSEAKKVINFLNLFLPDLKRIKTINNYEWERYGFPGHPIIQQLGKSFVGYPYIYIDGCEIENSLPRELIIISIAKIIEDDLLSTIRIGNIQIGGGW